MNKKLWNIAVTTPAVVVIGLVLLMVIGMFVGGPQSKMVGIVPFTAFMSQLEEGKIADAVITGHSITYHLSHGGVICSTYLPDGINVVDKLLAKQVTVTVKPDTGGELNVWTLLAYYIPVILYVIVIVYQRRFTIAVERLERHFTKKE